MEESRRIIERDVYEYLPHSTHITTGPSSEPGIMGEARQIIHCRGFVCVTDTIWKDRASQIDYFAIQFRGAVSKLES